ncbi:MAG: cytochrome C oxidase subunit IV family protein [Planctomycetota bacterium]|nr:cytochrome C oxidase subunit IV family protein [Planctomycetota bacterium]
MTATDHAAHGDHHEDHHALPLWMLVGTWGALMGLTLLTVFSAQFDLGAFDLPIAMGIATIKAMLVLLIFMHLGFDKGFHSLLIFGSLLFVFLFISFTLMDRGQYQGDITVKDSEKLLSD